MSTGERIEQLAKENGMSLHKLAALAGVSYNTLYSAAKRKSDRVDRKIIEKVSKALNIDIKSVISEEQIINDDNFTDIYDDWMDGETSPFYLYRVDEKVVVQKLLDAFLRLNRTNQVYLIEDAVMYLDRQEREKAEK